MNVRSLALLRMLLVLAAVLAIGCGGGSGDPADASADVADATDATDASDGAADTSDASSDIGTDSVDADVPDAGDAADGGPDAVDAVDATDTPDGDTADTTPPQPPREPILPAVLTCDGYAPAPLGTGCTVVEGATPGVVVRGLVLGDGTYWRGGSVVVDPSGAIACVGCDCDAGGRTVVDCPSSAVTPGFINAHDHITYTYEDPADAGDTRYNHRHEWRTGARSKPPIRYGDGSDDARIIAWGELRQLIMGTTSLAGSGGARGLVRNIDQNGDNREGLPGARVDYSTFPLGDASGALRSLDCSYPRMEGADRLEEDCYLPHIAEGIDAEARNEFLCLSSEDRGGNDLLAENTAIIHAVGILPDDVREIALDGASVIWSPRSNIALYGNTAPVTLLTNAGVNIGIGTDWTLSGSLHMLRELECAAYWNDAHLGAFFSSYELWRMATAANASALRHDDRIGALRTGLVADLAVIDVGDEVDPWGELFEATPDRVALVLRGGRPVHGDSAVMDAIPGAAAGCEVIGELCGRAKTTCLAETGFTFAELSAANAGSYDLFACGVPAGEPTCAPSRPGEYDGTTAGDRDGDGLPDSEDLCPDIFDAIRPLDLGAVADADRDGIGDACDACPLDVGPVCSVPTPGDRDGDTIGDGSDNCPRVANPDQRDRDVDGTGDVCDACPDDFNAAGAPCPSTIQRVRQGEVALGARVLLRGVITAVGPDLAYLQMAESEREPTLGADFSGIALFRFEGFAGPGAPSVGDFVEAAGDVQVFRGAQQLIVSALPTRLGRVGVPAPVAVSVSDIEPGGARAAALEGVRVELARAPVAVGADGTLTLGGLLRLSTRISNDLPPLFAGDLVDVVAIPRLEDGVIFLERASAADLVVAERAPPELLGFATERLFAPAGQDDIATLPVPISVELDRPAPAGGTSVALSSANDTLLDVPSTVVVSEGATTAAFAVTTGSAAGPTPVEVTATLGDQSARATVVVYPDAAARTVAAVEPGSLELTVGGGADVIVRLSLPAPRGGIEVTTRSANAAIATAATIGFPEGEVERTARIVAGDEGGATTVFFALGGTETPVAVNVAEFGTPRAPRAGELVFTEIMARSASGGGDRGEWLELHNPTRDPLVLDGCTVFDNADHPIAGSLTIAPLAYAVFALSNNAADNGGLPAVDYVYTTIALNNSGETVGLRCGDDVIDTFTYTSGMVALAASAQLRTVPPDALANDAATNWCVAPVDVTFGDSSRRGTPGAPTRCE
jgi:hypothetical protein